MREIYITPEHIKDAIETLFDEKEELEVENKKLHSIIKEVREYVKPVIVDGKEKELFINGNDILDILDKEN